MQKELQTMFHCSPYGLWSTLLSICTGTRIFKSTLRTLQVHIKVNIYSAACKIRITGTVFSCTQYWTKVQCACTLLMVYYAHNNARGALYNAHGVQCTVQCTWCTMHIAMHVVYNAHCNAHGVQCTLQCTWCTMHNTMDMVYCTIHMVHNVPYQYMMYYPVNNYALNSPVLFNLTE